ncbi:putative deoxynucleoside monophosphate kinase [Escherichia phage EcSzw_1]|nr:putative deoxynucleoside monophosphate kinase [Escherichia phage EcSzw-2]QAY00996.1 putative deoxynucleoside monophosphate kinase [Escherichia phage EcSzw_1]
MKSIIAFTGKARSGKDTSCMLTKNFLQEEEGYNVHIFAFADSLKESAAYIFGLDWNDLYGETKETPQKFNLRFSDLYFAVQWSLEQVFPHKNLHLDVKLCGELTGRLIMELKKVAKPTLLTRMGLSKTYKFSSRQIQQIWGTEVVRKVLGEKFWIRDLAERMERFFESCSKANQYGIALISDLRFDHEAEFLKSFDSQIIEVKRDNLVKVSSHKSENGISTKFERDIIQNNGSLEDLENKLKAIIIK